MRRVSLQPMRFNQLNSSGSNKQSAYQVWKRNKISTNEIKAAFQLRKRQPIRCCECGNLTEKTSQVSICNCFKFMLQILVSKILKGAEFGSGVIHQFKCSMLAPA